MSYPTDPAELWMRGARRLLGRYYDPDFVRLSTGVLILSLFGIHGPLTGIEGSPGLLGLLAVCELWLIYKLIRGEHRWRSRSGVIR